MDISFVPVLKFFQNFTKLLVEESWPLHLMGARELMQYLIDSTVILLFKLCTIQVCNYFDFHSGLSSILADRNRITSVSFPES